MQFSFLFVSKMKDSSFLPFWEEILIDIIVLEFRESSLESIHVEEYSFLLEKEERDSTGKENRNKEGESSCWRLNKD